MRHCATHDFRTDDVKLWQKHHAELSHEFDAKNKKCNKCGTLVKYTVYIGTREAHKNPITCEACDKKTYEAVKAKMEAIEKAKKEVPAQ